MLVRWPHALVHPQGAAGLVGRKNRHQLVWRWGARRQGFLVDVGAGDQSIMLWLGDDDSLDGNTFGRN